MIYASRMKERILYHACNASISCGVSRISYCVSNISLIRPENQKTRKKLLTNEDRRGIIFERQANVWRVYARVVELVDSLDSGSSAHSGRGGSTPPSRTIRKGLPEGSPFSFVAINGCLRYDREKGGSYDGSASGYR